MRSNHVHVRLKSANQCTVVPHQDHTFPSALWLVYIKVFFTVLLILSAPKNTISALGGVFLGRYLSPAVFYNTLREPGNEFMTYI